MGPGQVSLRRVLWVPGCVSLCPRPVAVSHTPQLACVRPAPGSRSRVGGGGGPGMRLGPHPCPSLGRDTPGRCLEGCLEDGHQVETCRGAGHEGGVLAAHGGNCLCRGVGGVGDIIPEILHGQLQMGF